MRNASPMPPRRVLIAHQSTIPHYRVRFYELLEERRPPDWTFEVVYDTAEAENPRIYLEPVDWRAFRFPILDARTRILRVGGRRVLWQGFLGAARRCDLVVTDTHIVNLAYLAVGLLRPAGVRRAFWGHAGDRNEVAHPGALKRLAEGFKRRLLARSDFFLAYTEQEAALLRGRGYPAGRIVVLNNTIDVRAERACREELLPRTAELRARLGVTDKKVLVFVGRLIGMKRLDFLLEAFACAHRADAALHLFVVGTGPDEHKVRALRDELGPGAVTLFGPLVKREEIGPVFAAGDVFTIPGGIGLAPIQAACHDLPTIAFDVPGHGPEIDYLVPANSDTLPGATTAQEFGRLLPGLMDKWSDPARRGGIFPTVRHLTLESMADRFIEGVNRALGIGA